MFLKNKHGGHGCWCSSDKRLCGIDGCECSIDDRFCNSGGCNCGTGGCECTFATRSDRNRGEQRSGCARSLRKIRSSAPGGDEKPGMKKDPRWRVLPGAGFCFSLRGCWEQCKGKRVGWETKVMGLVGDAGRERWRMFPRCQFFSLNYNQPEWNKRAGQ